MEAGWEGEMARSRIDLRNMMARAAIVGKRRSQDDELFAEELFFDHEELEHIKRARNTGPRPGGTNATGRKNYAESTWARMLRDQSAQLKSHTSPESKVFRNRFRVPFAIFERLALWAKGWHEKGKADASGRRRIPTELKVLGVLRILGRATCFDGIEELSSISVPTMQGFFHQFTSKVRSELYDLHVHMPKTKEEMSEAEAPYAVLGFPGAFFSMDVVHVAWCMCPEYLNHLTKGKEGFPTIAYNVCSDHQGRALSVCPGAYGATNDKTIVKFDTAIDEVRTRSFFTEYEYEVRTGPGDEDRKMESGAWGIVDGGYLKWAVTQAADKVCSLPGYARWRMQMESVRKDIECFFGRLKARFRILKTPLSFHDKKQIDDLFFTCVTLQNLLLDWDVGSGRVVGWEVDPGWGLFEDDESGASDARLWSRPKLRRFGKFNEFFTPEPTADFSEFGRSCMPAHTARLLTKTPPVPGEAQRYEKKQSALVEHFTHAVSAGAVHWLR